MGRALKRNLLRKFNTFARTVLSIGAHQGDSFTCSVGFCGAVWFMANPFDSVFKYFKLLVVLMVGDVMVVDGAAHASQKKKIPGFFFQTQLRNWMKGSHCASAHRSLQPQSNLFLC